MRGSDKQTGTHFCYLSGYAPSAPLIHRQRVARLGIWLPAIAEHVAEFVPVQH